MTSVTIIPIDHGTWPTMQIQMMQDHYAVLANGYVVGTIERAIGDGNEGKWGLHWLDGSTPWNFIPLHHAMREAMKWRP
jgi:hypothetical protein